MSALGIGLAWAALAMVAFMALSATAMARTRHDLEGSLGATGDRTGTREEASLSATTVPDHWVRPSATRTALRSSPSVAYMTASAPPGRPGPVHLS